MNIFNVFALMVIGWVIVEVVKAWRGTGTKRAKDYEDGLMNDLFGSGWDESSKVKALNQEISSLKERVATLEAIVTDEKYQLKKEIDKL
mgnify:CR=1 FL=1